MSEHDWEAECRGLGTMILDIAERYRQAREHFGGDSELVYSAVTTYERYVTEVLREKLGPTREKAS